VVQYAHAVVAQVVQQQVAQRGLGCELEHGRELEAQLRVERRRQDEQAVARHRHALRGAVTIVLG